DGADHQRIDLFEPAADTAFHRAFAAGHLADGCPGSGADTALEKTDRLRGIACRVGHVGRWPRVRSAEGKEVEDDGRGNDRNDEITHGMPALVLLHPAHNAGGSVESEGRSAGQHHGVDAIGEAGRGERVEFASAGRSTHDAVSTAPAALLVPHDGDSGSTLT